MLHVLDWLRKYKVKRANKERSQQEKRPISACAKLQNSDIASAEARFVNLGLSTWKYDRQWFVIVVRSLYLFRSTAHKINCVQYFTWSHGKVKDRYTHTYM